MWKKNRFGSRQVILVFVFAGDFIIHFSSLQCLVKLHYRFLTPSVVSSSQLDRVDNITLQSQRLESLLEALGQFGDVSCAMVESGTKFLRGMLVWTEI
jgi:hypothetical protein